jgi:hypothetical protein
MVVVRQGLKSTICPCCTKALRLTTQYFAFVSHFCDNYYPAKRANNVQGQSTLMNMACESKYILVHVRETAYFQSTFTYVNQSIERGRAF